MLSGITYRSYARGGGDVESIEFGKNGLYIGENNLFNYSHVADLVNDRISGFRREVATYSVTIIVAATTEAEATAKKNNLLDMFERGVAEKIPGAFVVNEYELYGYVTASEKGNWSIDKRYMPVTITFTCERPTWVKIHGFGIISGTNTVTIPEALRSKEFDVSLFFKNVSGTEASVEFYSQQTGVFDNVKYGCSNASEIECGYGLEINTRYRKYEATEAAVTTGGTEAYSVTSAFRYRLNKLKPFQKLKPNGLSELSAVVKGAASVWVSFYEERSEPKWT